MQLTRNRAVPEHGRLGTGRLGSIGSWFAPARITSLSPTELAGRLAETDFGKTLAARAGGVADVAVDDLARRFERIGADASAYFQQRATTLSLLVAMAIAFGLNVDAVRLYTVLGADPLMAQRLLDQGNAQRSAGQGDKKPASGGVVPSNEQAQPQQLDAELQRARTQTAEVLASGLPIGSRYFPYCDDGGLGDPCVTLANAIEKAKIGRGEWFKWIPLTLVTIPAIPTLWLRWLSFTVLSGLLIGLGSPFWFSAFTRLAGLLEIGRVLGLRTRYDTEAGNVREAAVQPATAPPPTPSAAFRAALPLPVRRQVLAPNGSALKR
jgi:hypothetical protein